MPWKGQLPGVEYSLIIPGVHNMSSSRGGCLPLVLTKQGLWALPGPANA